MNFTFDPETHVYKLDNRVLPSVTQIIKEVFGSRPHWSVESAEVGHALHLAIHYSNSSELEPSSIDGRVRGRLDGYNKFRVETKYTIIESELMLFSKKYRYAGTIDLVLKQGHLVLADIKSSYDPLNLIQLGGYLLLLKENGIITKEAFLLILSKNGTFKFSDFVKGTQINKWCNSFLNILSTYNLMKECKV